MKVVVCALLTQQLWKVFTPDLLYIQQMWAILKISGKIPALNILLNICVKGKDNGVAIIETNLPGIPQCDEYDFLISR